MPMERDSHEDILNKLNNPELEHSERTELLQQLRADYTTVLTEFSDLTSATEKLLAENSDLIGSNSKLFRQVGITKEKEEEIKQEELSETITIEDLEKQAQL